MGHHGIIVFVKFLQDGPLSSPTSPSSSPAGFVTIETRVLVRGAATTSRNGFLVAHLLPQTALRRPLLQLRMGSLVRVRPLRSHADVHRLRLRDPFSPNSPRSLLVQPVDHHRQDRLRLLLQTGSRDLPGLFPQRGLSCAGFAPTESSAPAAPVGCFGSVI
jgi:hypothetical protein